MPYTLGEPVVIDALVYSGDGKARMRKVSTFSLYCNHNTVLHGIPEAERESYKEYIFHLDQEEATVMFLEAMRGMYVFGLGLGEKGEGLLEGLCMWAFWLGVAAILCYFFLLPILDVTIEFSDIIGGWF